MTFIIFWAAIFAIIFFLIGVVCKGLASVFNGAVKTITFVGAIGLLGGLAAVALCLIYAIVHGIITEGFMSVLELIIMFLFEIGIIILVIGWLGPIIVEVIAFVVMLVVGFVSDVLEFAADACERAYGYFLNAIIKQLEKMLME